jgi:nicotinic acid mononucleotide adenylyltransferase
VHLGVTGRPGFGLQDLPETVEQLVQQFGCDHLPWKSHGHIVFFSMSPVPISSTLLRRELATWTTLSEPRLGAHVEAQALRGFLGEPLLDYIKQHGLYRPILADSEQDPQRSH